MAIFAEDAFGILDNVFSASPDGVYVFGREDFVLGGGFDAKVLVEADMGEQMFFVLVLGSKHNNWDAFIKIIFIIL